MGTAAIKGVSQGYDFVGRIKAVERAPGRAPIDPKILMTLWLYATVEGKVNGRRVWVRVTEREPNVSQVLVQTRNSAGGSDLDLAHELEKQIALKLVR